MGPLQVCPVAHVQVSVPPQPSAIDPHWVDVHLLGTQLDMHLLAEHEVPAGQAGQVSVDVHPSEITPHVSAAQEVRGVHAVVVGKVTDVVARLVIL